jgi:hypothetical protein
MERHFKTICIRCHWHVRRKYSIEIQVITRISIGTILTKVMMGIIKHLQQPRHHQQNILELLVQVQVLIKNNFILKDFSHKLIKNIFVYFKVNELVGTAISRQKINYEDV